MSATVVSARPAARLERSVDPWVRSLRRVEAWLFAPGDARRLAAMRIGLCAVMAIRSSRGVFLALAGQPRALYRPLSFMRLLPAMPSRWVVLPVQVLAIAAAVMAAAGLRTRVTVPAAWAAAVLLNGMATSVGKVVHNDVMLLLCMVPLLAAPSGDAWSVDAVLDRRRLHRSERPERVSVRYGWPVRTAMVAAAGAYFFTGLAKLVFSGPAWVFSSNLRWVLYAASDAHAAPNHLALLIANRPALAHALAALTLVVELGFPLVLLRPRAAWFFVPAAVGLHLAIRLTMGLDYSAWAATVLIVFVDWPAVARRVTDRTSARSLAGMAKATVLYDADCGFCRWSMDKLLAWDRRGNLRPVALQDPESNRLLPGMDHDTKMRSWHIVTPEGRVRSAGAAFPPMLRLLPGGRPLAALAGAMPRLTDRAYRFVSRHRDRIAKVLGTKACVVDPQARPQAKP